jgi:hypothetical protein
MELLGDLSPAATAEKSQTYTSQGQELPLMISGFYWYTAIPSP